MTAKAIIRIAIVTAAVLAAPLVSLIGGESASARAHDFIQARVIVAPRPVTIGVAFPVPAYAVPAYPVAAFPVPVRAWAPGPVAINVRPGIAIGLSGSHVCRLHPAAGIHEAHELRKSVHRTVRSHVIGLAGNLHRAHKRIHRAIFH